MLQILEYILNKKLVIYCLTLILSQDMYKVILVYLLILCAQSCNNDQMAFGMHNVL
jgi:hypothetical protein